MRSVLYLLAILFLVSGCRAKDKGEKECMQRCDYHPHSEFLSEEIITFSRGLRDSHSLFLYKSGVVFDGNMKRVCIDYTSQRSVELCRAREIIVDITEGLLDRLNDHPELSMAFNNYPITPEDFRIQVTFESYFNKYVDPTYTAYIILEKGQCFFYNSELNMPYTDIWMQKVEPYYLTKQFVTLSREAEKEHKAPDKEVVEEKILRDDRFYPYGMSTNF